MRCPWCGESLVMIRGDRWECGWCGDSGKLKQTADAVQVTVSIPLTIVYRVDLSETWEALKTALAGAAPGAEAELRPLLGKALFYAVSAGVQHRGAATEGRKWKELETFLKETGDLHTELPPDGTLRAIRGGVLYVREGQLSEETCGTFWAGLISALTPEQYYDGTPEGVSDLFDELSAAYAYFGGADGEEMGLAQARRNAWEDAFYLHWQEKLLRRPDGARARRLLARGELPPQEDICRDILAAEFPEEVAGYTLEELEDRPWRYILDDVLARDGAKGVRMWRALLDAAGPRLGSDPELAEELLVDWDALSDPAPETAEAFLAALEDEGFVEQVFQGACVGNLQRSLLALCRRSGRAELGRRCLDLVLANPHLGSEAWERRLRQALDPGERRPGPRKPAKPEAEPPDDGAVFHYCTVRFRNAPRPYAYLTGGLPVKVGDWVEAPFGREDLPRRGQVIAVADCTRPAAPWPPERTKTVLRLAEPLPPQEEASPAPTPAPEPIPPSTPEPEGDAEPPSVSEGKPAPVSPQPPAAPAEEERPAEPDSAAAQPNGAPTVRRTRRVPWKTIWGVCVVCAVLIGVAGGAVTYHRWDARHRQAEQALLAGDISAAAEQLARIPAFFRSERLVRYTELCALAQSGTEQALETALEGIGRIAEESGEPLRSAMEEQYDAIERQYQELFYQRALDQLQAERFDQAEEYLQQALGLPHAAALLRYAQAGAGADPDGSSADLKRALSLLGQVPTGYEGPFAEEIAALRAELEEMIPAAAAREEAERAAAQETGGTTARPTVRPPHTFNSGGAGGSYAGDTGAGSGHSLREDYGSPEDLYEDDGTYSDLDEAIDEWEEGW